MMEIKQNIKNYKVNTPTGFCNFSGISRTWCSNPILFKFHDGSEFSCSKEHPLFVDNLIRLAGFLIPGDEVQSATGTKKIIQITSGNPGWFYDLLDVDSPGHAYYADNILTHNCFLGSAPSLISGQKLAQFSQSVQKQKIKPTDVPLSKDFLEIQLQVYQPPVKGHPYIIGADPATGMQSDFHAMTVWDIADLSAVRLVAVFRKNNIPPKFFAYAVVKTAVLYNNAYVAIQNNGVSFATLDKIADDFGYQNIINDTKNRKSIGISSSDDKKLDACLFFKAFVEDPSRTIVLGDRLLVQEMQHFEKVQKPGKAPRYMCRQGHDDLIMGMIWAFYYLRPEWLESLYRVVRYTKDKFGNQLPALLENEPTGNYRLSQIDSVLSAKFSSQKPQPESSSNSFTASFF